MIHPDQEACFLRSPKTVSLQRWRLICAPLLFAVPLLAGCGAEPPTDLGIEGGRLAPCPDTPNCVSTREEAEDTDHHMKPISFSGSPEEAMEAVAGAVEEMPRTEIVHNEDDYLRAKFTSRIFRFVDDVEFRADGETSLIDFRSASRVGYSDMGINRERMTEITATLEARLGG
jgi:uncharacterized protein (DUF1499 family)